MNKLDDRVFDGPTVFNAVKAWVNWGAVDKALEIADGEDLTLIKRGSVVHVDAVSGHYKLGGAENAVPLFNLENATDYDIGSTKSNMAGGKANALVSIFGYEVYSSEFVDDTYAPNDPLTPEGAGDDLGKVKKGVFYTDTVCGVVSEGIKQNESNKDVLYFWTYFLPQLPA